MKLSPDEVQRIATLARLHLAPAEIEPYAQELTRILEYVEKISEVDVSGFDPMTYPGTPDTPMREDEVTPCLDRETVLAQAPDAAHGLFRVPAVLPTQQAQPDRND